MEAKTTSAEKRQISTTIENPEIEYFWSFELTAEKSSHTWNDKDEDLEDDDEDFINHTVFIKQACLGDGAVPGEANIVQMESLGASGKPNKGTIINLTKGENAMARLDITVSGKVGATFTLVSGSGPIHISGNHLMEFPKEDDLNDMSQTESELSMTEEDLKDREKEDEEEAEEEAEEEDEEGDSDELEEEEEEEKKAASNKKNAKRKGPVKGGKSKKVRMDVDEDEDDEDEDDDDEDEDDEDYEVPAPTKKGKKVPAAKEAPAKGKAKAKEVVENGNAKKAKKVKK